MEFIACEMHNLKRLKISFDHIKKFDYSERNVFENSNLIDLTVKYHHTNICNIKSIHFILEQFSNVQYLSLDCFDTFWNFWVPEKFFKIVFPKLQYLYVSSSDNILLQRALFPNLKKLKVGCYSNKCGVNVPTISTLTDLNILCTEIKISEIITNFHSIKNLQLGEGVDLEKDEFLMILNNLLFLEKLTVKKESIKFKVDRNKSCFNIKNVKIYFTD